MNKGQTEVDCTRKCKSKSHGGTIVSAITKRSISDQNLASFIRANCANFSYVLDLEGRTALHMAASRGRTALVDWLLRHSPLTVISAKDEESGYSPLHRAIFYGQIHTTVQLMKMGVSTDILDKDDFRPLEHAMLDRQYMYKHEGSQPCDVYVWGTNSNYTLGTGTQQQKLTPDILNCFSKGNVSVSQVWLGKFHSVWVCSGGTVLACGALSRAGAGSAAGTSLRPVALRLSEPCLQAAIMLHATVLLMQTGTVVQYTLNNSDTSTNQSNNATPSSIRLTSVKPLIKLSEPLGVCCSRVHGAVWNARAVYTWGTNLGQLGHSPGEKFVETPKKVLISLNNRDESSVKLQLVDASDAATVITTSRGDVYLLHKHLLKKIASKQINIRQICVDAKMNEQGAYSRVTVLLLTNVGQLLIWQDSTNRLTRCVFGFVHQTTITHMALTHDFLYFTTKYGEAFVGSISRKVNAVQAAPRKEKEWDSNNTSLVKFLEKDDCTAVRVTKIPNIQRAVSIAVDSEGLNFACLQIKPTCGLTSLPELSPSSMSKHMESLLETASEGDLLHDVLFKVGQKLFPAHMFIIASNSEFLYKHYQEQKTINPGEIPTIAIDNVHHEVFDRILRYMYTGTCDVTQLGHCDLKIKREELVKDGKKEKEIVEELLIENPQEVSAFEAYKGQNGKPKKGSRKQRSVDSPIRAPYPYCDPVKLVQAAAKRLNVMTLHKLLEKFYFREGKVCLKESATPSEVQRPHFDRERFPELVDTHVCSRDGVSISAHKCILAARLDYFQGMFMHSWSESKLLSTVTLPITHAILSPVIQFLYTDSCPEIESSESIDFICSMLIVADQLFISRLREMCEVALVNLITLKNCAEICQFAHTYNASQLKQSCMEFISLNLYFMLENNCLDSLTGDLLEDITRYYCKFNSIMGSRVITPFYNAPTDEAIEECARSYPIDLSVTNEEMKKEELEMKKKYKSRKIEYSETEKARKRYESVSSVNSLDLSQDTSGDITLSLTNISKETESVNKEPAKWVKVPTSQSKVQARLKAISSAKDILKEAPVESFVTLTKNSSFTSGSPTSYSRLSVSPKESLLSESAQSPPSSGGLLITHSGPKLSQKQRKKLAMQGSEVPTHTLDTFFDKKLTIETPAKPKNPWKIIEPQSTSSPAIRKAPEFNKILADQKKEKDDSSRIMTKPLSLTQLEDKAIEELEKFYNVYGVDDELITVRRIELQVARPMWVTSPKS